MAISAARGLVAVAEEQPIQAPPGWTQTYVSAARGGGSPASVSGQLERARLRGEKARGGRRRRRKATRTGESERARPRRDRHRPPARRPARKTSLRPTCARIELERTPQHAGRAVGLGAHDRTITFALGAVAGAALPGSANSLQPAGSGPSPQAAARCARTPGQAGQRRRQPACSRTAKLTSEAVTQAQRDAVQSGCRPSVTPPI